MILESAQMLFTVGSELGFETPYKPTHSNHPCTKWVKESKQNFDWLFQLAYALNDEWQHRYRHSPDTYHKSIDKLFDYDVINFSNSLPDIGLTPFAQAMPEQYKDNDAVVAYRNYYINDKADLLNYTNRSKTEWLK
jgi:hypothetical protein